MNYIDLTRTVTPDIQVYPGDPCPIFHKLNDVEHDGFEMYEVTSGMHVGTHMDAPLHFVKNGQRIDELPTDRFLGNGQLIDLKKHKAPHTLFGEILLIRTEHEQLWGTSKYFTAYPTLTIEFAQQCVDSNVKMVCVDMPSVDYPPHDVHKLLLAHGILIIENIYNLAAVEGIERFKVMAMPVKYATEAAPCRVIVSPVV